MKKYKKHIYLFVLASHLFLFGCVTVPANEGQSPKKITMNNNRRYPKMSANLTVSSTPNNTNLIELSVKHLPKAKNYVVWEVPTGFGMKPQSIGLLNVDKNFNGTLKMATPFKSFDIFVTAEAKLSPAPTGEKLFWSKVTH